MIRYFDYTIRVLVKMKIPRCWEAFDMGRRGVNIKLRRRVDGTSFTRALGPI